MINVTCGLTAYPGSAGSGSLPNLCMPTSGTSQQALRCRRQRNGATNQLSANVKSSFGCILLLNKIYLITVPFDNTTPIHLISLLWKLGLRLGLDLELHYFQIFLQRITKTSTLSSANFTVGNMLLKERTQTTTWQQNGHRAIPVIRPLR